MVAIQSFGIRICEAVNEDKNYWKEICGQGTVESKEDNLGTGFAILEHWN